MILVTGNRGYIGTVMTKMLKAASYEVIGLDSDWYRDNHFYIDDANPNKQIIKDIRNVTSEDLDGVKGVIHLAALSNDPLGEINPTITHQINCDAAIQLAKLCKKKVKIKEGIKKDKIVVIPNGLDITKLTISQITRTDYEEEIRKRYGINKNAFVFGNLGRISREKGHDILLDAYKKFLGTDMYHSKDFMLFIAGGGESEDEIRKLAATKGIADKVIFTGEFPPEDLVKYYSAFDFFVFPTLAEGFGLVLIEAMYSELPVICSDLEVLKEVAGDTVTYFRAGDSSDLAEKMIEAYEKYVNNENIPHLQGKQRVTELYTIKAFTNSYVSLYERLLKKK